jgi:outer membrane biosynthesis protein TonB
MRCTVVPNTILLFLVSSVFAPSSGQILEPFSKGVLLAALRAGQTAGAPQAKEQTTQTRTGGAVVPPKLIYSVSPADWSSGGPTGTVRFDAVIGTDGKLRDFKLLSGDPALAKTALKTLAKWRYQPGLLNGKPTDMRTEVEMSFGAKKRSH